MQTHAVVKLHIKQAHGGRNDAKCFVAEQRVDGVNLPKAKSIPFKIKLLFHCTINTWSSLYSRIKRCNLHLVVNPLCLIFADLCCAFWFSPFYTHALLSVPCVGENRDNNTAKIFLAVVRVMLRIQKSTYILVFWGFSQMMSLPRLWWISSPAIIPILWLSELYSETWHLPGPFPFHCTPG